MLIKGTVKGYGPVEFNVTSVEFGDTAKQPSGDKHDDQQVIAVALAKIIRTFNVTYGLAVNSYDERDLRKTLQWLVANTR